MDARVEVRTESRRKGLVRRDVLERIARRVLQAERPALNAAVVSVLFCDDAAMAALNQQFRRVPHATDVLSFEPGEHSGAETLLGDIVVSLETVERRNRGDRKAMRAEVRLLFCHGLLHLLGYHHSTREARQVMVRKQSQYLLVSEEAAWVGGVS